MIHCLSDRNGKKDKNLNSFGKNVFQNQPFFAIQRNIKMRIGSVNDIANTAIISIRTKKKLKKNKLQRISEKRKI